jgi:hypothetical protein
MAAERSLEAHLPTGTAHKAEGPCCVANLVKTAEVLALRCSRSVGPIAMDSGEVHEAFYSEVGKSHDLFVARAIDPDQSVFGLHLAGDLRGPVFVFAEFDSDAGNGGDAIYLFDVHVRRPRRRRGRAANSTAIAHDALGRMGGDASEDVSEPSLGVDVVHLGGRDQAVEDGRALSGRSSRA